MKVSFNTKTSGVTIKLSWPEVRQFMSSQAAVEVVRQGIRDCPALSSTDWHQHVWSRATEEDAIERCACGAER